MIGKSQDGLNILRGILNMGGNRCPRRTCKKQHSGRSAIFRNQLNKKYKRENSIRTEIIKYLVAKLQGGIDLLIKMVRKG